MYMNVWALLGRVPYTCLETRWEHRVGDVLKLSYFLNQNFSFVLELKNCSVLNFQCAKKPFCNAFERI